MYYVFPVIDIEATEVVLVCKNKNGSKSRLDAEVYKIFPVDGTVTHATHFGAYDVDAGYLNEKCRLPTKEDAFIVNKAVHFFSVHLNEEVRVAKHSFWKTKAKE